MGGEGSGEGGGGEGIGGEGIGIGGKGGDWKGGGEGGGGEGGGGGGAGQTLSLIDDRSKFRFHRGRGRGGSLRQSERLRSDFPRVSRVDRRLIERALLALSSARARRQQSALAHVLDMCSAESGRGPVLTCRLDTVSESPDEGLDDAPFKQGRATTLILQVR